MAACLPLLRLYLLNNSRRITWGTSDKSQHNRIDGINSSKIHLVNDFFSVAFPNMPPSNPHRFFILWFWVFFCKIKPKPGKCLNRSKWLNSQSEILLNPFYRFREGTPGGLETFFQISTPRLSYLDHLLHILLTFKYACCLHIISNR